MNKQIIFSLLLTANITTYAMLTTNAQENLSNKALEQFFKNIHKQEQQVSINNENDPMNKIIANSRFTKAQGPNKDLFFTQGCIFRITQSHYKSIHGSTSKL